MKSNWMDINIDLLKRASGDESLSIYGQNGVFAVVQNRDNTHFALSSYMSKKSLHVWISGFIEGLKYK